jgi:uncharacterized membrane protein
LHLLQIVLAVGTLVCIPLCATPVYSIGNIGGLGGTRSEAFAINADGVVAGVARTADQKTDLPVVYDGTRLRNVSEAAGQINGINNGGVAVGTTYTGSGARAAVWDGTGERPLSTLSGGETTPWQ